MKRNIAIVAGGDSGEYDISIKSAAVVKEHLDREKFNPFLIVIKGKDWRYIDDVNLEHAINKEDFSISLNGRKITFDAVFVAIHGTPGEDGKLQAYFDLLDIPYTSCDQTTSALTFNKHFSLVLASGYGARVAPSAVLHLGQEVEPERLIELVGLPCFVKPNQGGSSVGMSKVKDAAGLPNAIARAFEEDTQVLIESYIPGREITCGVFYDAGAVRSLPVTEVISKKEFFDYEAKYTDGMAEEITPADIPADIEKECRSTSEHLYRSMNCKGLVRFDYIYNEEGMYFLEVNTVPGLSPNSIIPQQAAAVGISLRELFSIILSETLS